MREIDLQKAAVISQGQLDLLGRADVAHAPIRGRKQASGNSKIDTFQIVAVFLQIGERHAVGKLCSDVELDVAAAEKDEDEVRVFLFLRLVNVERQRRLVIKLDLRDGDGLPAHAFCIAAG